MIRLGPHPEPQRSKPEPQSNSTGLLKSFVKRIESIKAEQAELTAEIREVYEEAAAAGFDKTLIGMMVRDAWQARRGFRVYFAAFRSKHALKIGISQNVPARLNELSRRMGERAQLLADVPGTFPEEGWYHATFDPWRLRGEWFELNDETTALVQFIKAFKDANPDKIPNFLTAEGAREEGIGSRDVVVRHASAAPTPAGRVSDESPGTSPQPQDAGPAPAFLIRKGAAA